MDEHIKLDGDLAEFLGIMSGDGYIGKLNNEITVTGHILRDKHYMHLQVAPLFEKLFGIKPKMRTQPKFSAIRCRVYSKYLAEFFSSEFSFPRGKKTEQLAIPIKIKENRQLIISFIRGLFDTDGSVYTHHGNDLMLEISAVGKRFHEDIFEALQSLDFHPYRGINKIILYRQSEIAKFFKLVKPKNDNHIRRFTELNMRR